MAISFKKFFKISILNVNTYYPILTYLAGFRSQPPICSSCDARLRLVAAAIIISIWFEVQNLCESFVDLKCQISISNVGKFEDESLIPFGISKRIKLIRRFAYNGNQFLIPTKHNCSHSWYSVFQCCIQINGSRVSINLGLSYRVTHKG